MVLNQEQRGWSRLDLEVEDTNMVPSISSPVVLVGRQQPVDHIKLVVRLLVA